MINWNLTLSLGGSRYHSLKFVGEYKGVNVEKEVYTPVIEDGFGEAKVDYYISRTGERFSSEQDLVNKINEISV